jgi:YidC/Oxa1 family membrane protein insertase
MEKRVFLAIFLSFIVLALYQSMFAPSPVAPTAPAPPPQAASTPPADVGAIATPPHAGPAEDSAPQFPAVSVLVGEPAVQDVVIETASVIAVFSNQGATLKSWRLRHYQGDDGQPIDLVPNDLPAGRYARPFSVVTGKADIDAALDRALFRPSVAALTLDGGPGTLTFEYRDASGLSARKTFYFQPEGQSYVLNVETSLELNGAPQPFTLHFGPAVGPGSTSTSAFAGWMAVRALVHANGSVERVAADDIAAQAKREGAIRFAGVDEHYFLAAALPAADRAAVEYEAISLPVVGDATGLTRSLIAFAVSPNPGVTPSQAVSVRFYLGPKDFNSLRAADAQLVRAIDFGMFAFLVVPLLQALKWIQGFIGNYGWSIVVLTIILNVILFPLRHRSMVSMKKMQALQPEVKAIQERYAK